MSTPRRHHFIPAFYLQQWAECDGRLIEFSKVRSKLIQKLVGPRATGFETDLYTLNDLSPNSTRHLEEKFFNSVDGTASEALRMLLSQSDAPWTPDRRNAWIVFLICMEMRHPDSIAELKSAAKEIWAETEVEFKSQYQDIRAEHHPQTYDDYLEQRDPYDDAWGRFGIIEHALQDHIVRDRIAAMRWFVFDTSGARHTLLTSDRAILVSHLDHIDGFVAMPISPSKLFFAANGQHSIDELRLRSPDDLVFNSNKHVVERARRFVWGKDASLAEFVEQYMLTRLEPLPPRP